MLPQPQAALQRLPPYIFVRLNELKVRAAEAGKELIDLAMGNPDRPTPGNVVSALCRAAREDVWTHRYPQTRGLPELRRAIAGFYKRRFGVDLDPEREVVPLIGSKEGLAHLCFSYLGPGTSALIPSPCYPVHYNGPLLAGARADLMPLEEKNGFLPDLSAIPAAAARRARFLLVNYPNNPTGAVVEGLHFFKEVLRFAKGREMFVVHDNAYSELSFDGYEAPSLLQVPGSRAVGVEFHSLSKSYSMAGWRIGFAVGNARIIQTLTKFKSHVDYGVAGFIQKAAVEALSGPQGYVRQVAALYQSRRDVLCAALEGIGWPLRRPKAAMYLWGRLPEKARRWGSFGFAERLLLETGVVVAPGIGFGPHGEGYVRFALIETDERAREAVRRIGAFLARSRAPGA